MSCFKRLKLDLGNIEAEVHQSSILGLLLLLIYINDLSDGLVSNVDFSPVIIQSFLSLKMF